MDVQDVALVVFGELVQKDRALGVGAENDKETAKRAFQYADAFMQASLEHRNQRASVAPNRF